MTHTIDLTVAEESRLEAAARHAGIAPAVLLKRLMDGLPAEQPPPPPMPGNLAAILVARGSRLM